MVLVLKDGRRIVPAIMGHVSGDDETDRLPCISFRGYEISGNNDLFGNPLLVTAELHEIVDIEGSYMFPPIADLINKI